MKKVLFVNGPSQDACDRFFGWPTSLLYAIAPTVQAIDAGRLALEYKPDLFDPVWFVEGVNDREVFAAFTQAVEDADIVCASATYDSLYPTLRLLSLAKQLRPGVVTVLGGPHFDEVHLLPAHNDRHHDAHIVDYAIAGDGEHALLALLQYLSGATGSLDLAQVEGRAWLYGREGTLQTNGRPLDLNQLPFMPIGLADTERHQNNFDVFRRDGRILPTVQMMAKRGCAYSCEFCSERRELAYPNARSIDNILTEVELRKNQGFESVFFDDSTFGLYPKLRDLLKELAGSGMQFGSLNRFNHLLRPDVLALYKEAGFVYFYCAVEQFDDAALKLMHKAQDTERIERSMSLLEEYGFQLGVSLLYGLPYETDFSIQRTLDFTGRWVDRGLIRLVSESLLAFHPGTPAGRHLEARLNTPPPNKGYPFDAFEEGQWFHAKHVDATYLKQVLRLSEERFGHALVRNRHSWYSEQGYLLTDNNRRELRRAGDATS